MPQQYPPRPVPQGYLQNAQFGAPGPYLQPQQGYPQQRMPGPLPSVPLPPAGMSRKKILPSQKKKRILYVLSAALVVMALLALSTFVYFWMNFR
jgi:hypothetical protein